MAGEENDGEDLGAVIERELNDAIAEVLARHEKSMVTKWVAMVETMDSNGVRGLWPMTSPDVKAWDITGMLLHGLHLEQAQIYNGVDEE